MAYLTQTPDGVKVEYHHASGQVNSYHFIMAIVADIAAELDDCGWETEVIL